MTAEELIKQAEDMTDEAYTPAEWMEKLQAVLDELSPGARVLKSKNVTVTVTDGTTIISLSDEGIKAQSILSVYFAPTDGRERSLRRLTAAEGLSEGWKLAEGTITLLELGNNVETGTARVSYYERLTLTLSGEAPNQYHALNLPEKYHTVALMGLCVRAMQREEELERKKDFEANYNAGKQSMFAERMYEMEPWMRGRMK